MMLNIKVTIALIISTLLVGCGYHEQVVQRNELSYIQFIGDHSSEIIVIDDGDPYLLLGWALAEYKSDYEKNMHVLEPFSLNGIEATKISVSKGKHNIKVYRSNIEAGGAVLSKQDLLNKNLIIDKDIYISSGTTYEFELWKYY